MPPGCEAAHRLRQQTIQPGFVFGNVLDLPAANALVPSAGSLTLRVRATPTGERRACCLLPVACCLVRAGDGGRLRAVPAGGPVASSRRKNCGLVNFSLPFPCLCAIIYGRIFVGISRSLAK